MMLIAPRISNRVGEQIAHTTVEDFKALKSKSTYDEPTEKKESSEESTKRDDSEAESLRVRQVEEKGLNPESSNSSDNVPKIDFDRLLIRHTISQKGCMRALEKKTICGYLRCLALSKDFV